MRPQRLTLDGFRSYAAATTFDFSGRRLVGVVGPIGSGKSTILDAISFALYGKTHTEAAATKSLIHQRADAGKVELVFTAGGETWQVVRALRRHGQSEHAAYRYASLEALDGGEKPLERVLKKGEVDQRLAEVLGLDFAAFGRSVLLAQNRFAEFLRATPAERDAVLKGVFGFDRIDAMAAEAKTRRDRFGRDLEELDRRRRELDRDREALLVAQKELHRVVERLETIGPVVDALETTQRRKAEATTALESADRESARVATLGGRRPSPERVAELVRSAGAAADELEAAVAAVAAAEEGLRAATEMRDEATAAYGGIETIDKARVLASELEAERRRLSDLEERLAADRVVLQKLESAVAGSGDTLRLAREAVGVAAEKEREARQRFEATREAREAAMAADMAGTLRSALTPGDSCPVCEQVVSTIPAVGAVDTKAVDRDHDQAHAALDAARRQLSEAEKRVAVAETELAEREARLHAAAEATNALAERVAATQESIEERARGLVALVGTDDLGAMERRLAALDQAVAEATAEAERRRGELRRIETAHQQAQREMDALGRELATLAGALGLEIEMDGSVDSVSKASEEVDAAFAAAEAELGRARDAAVAALEAAEAARQDLLAAAGLAADTDVSAVVKELEAERVRIESQIEVRSERLSETERLIAEAGATAEKRDLYDVLARDLTPSNFLRFLLEEERRSLAHLGSERFEELSGGRYRFAEDGTFSIVDLTAAEQPRKADTLSGGETFLAALALALALAEMVGRGGGALDAFFLDEGFGSLDGEHLDLAMAGIERLVADHDDRIVVVVSHVPDMREMIEDLIVLDKDPATGATLVRRG